MASIIGKIQSVILGAILVFVPLFFYPKALISFETPKVFLFRIFIGFLLLTLILEFSFYKDRLILFLKFIQKNNFLKIPILIILVSTISTFSSDCVYLSFFGSEHRHFGLISLIYYVVYFYSVLYILQKDIVRKISKYSVLISMVMTMTIGSMQYFGLIPSLMAKVEFENIRLFSTIGQPNLLAGFLILSVPVLFLFKWTKKSLLLLLILLMFWLTLIYLSWSRVGMIVAILELCGFLYLLIKNKKIFAWMVSSIAILSSVIIFIFRDILSRHFNLETLYVRLIIFKGAILAFLNKPIFGYGFEGFKNISAKFIGPEISKYEFSKRVADRAHNIILDALINGGVIYLLLIISFFVLLIIHLYKKKIDLKNKAILVSVFCILIFLSMNFHTIIINVLLIFWFAYLISEQQNHPTKIRNKTHFMTPFILMIFVVSMTIVMSLPIFISDLALKKYFITDQVAYIRESIYVNKIRPSQYLYLAYEKASRMKFGKDLGEIQNIYNSAKENLDLFLKYGGDYTKYYLSLAKISRQKSVYSNNNFDNTYFYFKQAIEYNSYNPEIYGEWGITLFLNDEKTEANKKFDMFYKLIPNNKRLKLLEDPGISELKKIIDKIKK